MSLAGREDAIHANAVKHPSYKRVFQACANCRAKKHRCHLDPVSPQPPCLACSREGVPCGKVPES